jgi:hypothetical protein
MVREGKGEGRGGVPPVQRATGFSRIDSLPHLLDHNLAALFRLQQHRELCEKDGNGRPAAAEGFGRCHWKEWAGKGRRGEDSAKGRGS